MLIENSKHVFMKSMELLDNHLYQVLDKEALKTKIKIEANKDSNSNINTNLHQVTKILVCRVPINMLKVFQCRGNQFKVNQYKDRFKVSQHLLDLLINQILFTLRQIILNNKQETNNRIIKIEVGILLFKAKVLE
jgi:hypothetical protein